ncbi:MAG: CDP-diacylglycerol--glycerol-3-phosphate 3-phosphatidyltransferase [Candidatus Coproplasma sp.]
MDDREIDKDSRAYKIAAGKGVMNLPNKLTLSRVVMIPVFVLFFYLQFTGHFFVALAVFALASFTDFLDGKIARKYRLVTNLGKFLDPIADKVLVSTAMIVMLTVPSFFTAYLGSWAIIVAGCCVAVILGREIIVSGFRMVAADAGIVIAADKIGKYKTAAQDFSIVILLFGAGLGEFLVESVAVQVINLVGLCLFAIATILTIISGINYIIKNIAVLKV